jgi:hypothetical protein
MGSGRAVRTAAYDDVESTLGERLSTLWRHPLRTTFPRQQLGIEAVVERVALAKTSGPRELGIASATFPGLHQLLLANYERSVKARQRA